MVKHMMDRYLAKATDCVNHDLLLLKLNFYRISGEAEQWFKSYFNDREQKRGN
jgi:hypothetical protein